MTFFPPPNTVHFPPYFPHGENHFMNLIWSFQSVLSSHLYSPETTYMFLCVKMYINVSLRLHLIIFVFSILVILSLPYLFIFFVYSFFSFTLISVSFHSLIFPPSLFLWYFISSTHTHTHTHTHTYAPTHMII